MRPRDLPLCSSLCLFFLSALESHLRPARRGFSPSRRAARSPRTILKRLTALAMALILLPLAQVELFGQQGPWQGAPQYGQYATHIRRAHRTTSSTRQISNRPMGSRITRSRDTDNLALPQPIRTRAIRTTVLRRAALCRATSETTPSPGMAPRSQPRSLLLPSSSSRCWRL